MLIIESFPPEARNLHHSFTMFKCIGIVMNGVPAPWVDCNSGASSYMCRCSMDQL